MQPKPSMDQRPQSAPVPPSIALLRGVLRRCGNVAPDLTARALSTFTFRPFRMPRRPWEQEARAIARVWTIDGPSGSTPALEWGPEDPEGTVLMLHGWEGRASQFGPLGLVLASAGLRAVAIDMVGHGRAPSGASTPARWIGAVTDAMEVLGPLRGIVTHSMGAGPALASLAEGGAAERMVMISPPAAMGPRMRVGAERIGLTGRAADRFAERAVQRIVDHGGRADFDALARDHAPPTLVLHAPDDELVASSEGRVMASAARSGTFVETGPFGHFRILREPETTERVRAFLAPDSGPVDQTRSNSSSSAASTPVASSRSTSSE